MIEVITSFPDNVIGFKATGRVTRQDYLEVVIPAVEKARKTHSKTRLYYELGPQFSEIDLGAEWEDLKLGLEDYTRWERVAVVTEVGWIKHLVGAFRFVMPGEVRVFANPQVAEARRWIIAA
jgi:hypothetical protein